MGRLTAFGLFPPFLFFFLLPSPLPFFLRAAMTAVWKVEAAAKKPTTRPFFFSPFLPLSWPVPLFLGFADHVPGASVARCGPRRKSVFSSSFPPPPPPPFSFPFFARKRASIISRRVRQANWHEEFTKRFHRSQHPLFLPSLSPLFLRRSPRSTPCCGQQYCFFPPPLSLFPLVPAAARRERRQWACSIALSSACFLFLPFFPFFVASHCLTRSGTAACQSPARRLWMVERADFLPLFPPSSFPHLTSERLLLLWTEAVERAAGRGADEESFFSSPPPLPPPRFAD